MNKRNVPERLRKPMRQLGIDRTPGPSQRQRRQVVVKTERAKRATVKSSLAVTTTTETAATTTATPTSTNTATTTATTSTTAPTSDVSTPPTKPPRKKAKKVNPTTPTILDRRADVRIDPEIWLPDDNDRDTHLINLKQLMDKTVVDPSQPPAEKEFMVQTAHHRDPIRMWYTSVLAGGHPDQVLEQEVVDNFARQISMRANQPYDFALPRLLKSALHHNSDPLVRLTLNFKDAPSRRETDDELAARQAGVTEQIELRKDEAVAKILKKYPVQSRLAVVQTGGAAHGHYFLVVCFTKF